MTMILGVRRTVLLLVSALWILQTPVWAESHRLTANEPPIEVPVGGANSPLPSSPPKLVIETAEIPCGAFSISVPVGHYEAPKEGAPVYGVPGPIVAFKGADNVWRGHGYLETHPRLVKFDGKINGGSAKLLYSFEGGRTYTVGLVASNDVILLDESSDLGPRNLYIFDCYYGNWSPSSGFAVNSTAEKHAFLYLPCYYDKPEVTINVAAHSQSEGTTADVPPLGVAVTSADPVKKDVAGFWARDVAAWRSGDTMGIQLWQRRQCPGDPSSRHFLGPETKSDSTPNPRTASLLGKSLYEGHVTIEFALGIGTRRLGFSATNKGLEKKNIPDAFKLSVQKNL